MTHNSHLDYVHTNARTGTKMEENRIEYHVNIIAFAHTHVLHASTCSHMYIHIGTWQVNNVISC